MRAKVITLLVIAFLVALITAYNPTAVPIRFFTWQTSLPLIVIILGALVIGVILGVILSMGHESKLSRKIHEQADEIKYLKKELAKKPAETKETK